MPGGCREGCRGTALRLCTPLVLYGTPGQVQQCLVVLWAVRAVRVEHPCSRRLCGALLRVLL